MQSVGLTLDQYVDLKLKPFAGADPVFTEAAELERAEMFPMSLSQASNHLRSRGYDCRPPMLESLIRNKVVAPASPDAWTQADVDAAAEHFEDAQIYTPYVTACMAFGFTYAAFLLALRQAAEQASARYGRRVPADDQYFIMQRQPGRGDTPAIISFTLSPDIQEQLENGEEV